MIKPRKSLSIADRDRAGLGQLMRWHLERRHQMLPWPLSHEETHMLWWPQDQWDTLHSMTAAGCIPTNYKTVVTLYQGSVNVHLRHTSPGLLRASRPVPVAHSTRIKTDAPGYEEFIAWCHKAEAVAREHCLVLVAWNELLDEATSWRQLYKAFPEAFEILVGAGKAMVAHTSSTWENRDLHAHVVPKLQDAWDLLQGTSAIASRAAIMPCELLDMLDKARPEAARLCAQAALFDPSHSGEIDTTPFAKTWVEIRTK
jgi:hypothetical protein